MQKRGQVAVFVVLGMVLVILAVLLFVGRQQYGFGVSSVRFLDSKLQPIKTDAENCVSSSLSKNLDLFGKQGGDLNPLRYVFYEGKKVKYLCYNIVDSTKCVNMLPPLNVLIEGLNEKLDNDVKNCVNKGLLESGLGYSINVGGEPNTELKLLGDNLLVDVIYDVDIVKGESSQKLNKIKIPVDVSIVELYNVAFDIINKQASDGFFDQLFYMLDKKGKYIINVDKSPSLGNVGDVIYKINKKDDEYEFWFAIEGE